MSPALAGMFFTTSATWASLVAKVVRTSLQYGRPGFDAWVGKMPWRRERLPTPVIWPGEFRGLQSMGSQRVNMTEIFTIRITVLPVKPQVPQKKRVPGDYKFRLYSPPVL